MQGVGEKGLAAQETGVLVELCLLARSFAGSAAMCQDSGRMEFLLI